ncbi:MAG: hypothetical protein ACK53I_07780, partial [Phenylobacterium sp.]
RDSSAYQACSAELVNFDKYLGKAEDGVALEGALESEIETAARRLRGHLRRSSVTAKAFAILRGEVS